MQIGDRVLLRPEKELIGEYKLRDLPETSLLNYSNPMRNKVLEVIEVFEEDESMQGSGPYTIANVKHQEKTRLFYIFELIVLP